MWEKVSRPQRVASVFSKKVEMVPPECMEMMGRVDVAMC